MGGKDNLHLIRSQIIELYKQILLCPTIKVGNGTDIYVTTYQDCTHTQMHTCTRAHILRILTNYIGNSISLYSDPQNAHGNSTTTQGKGKCGRGEIWKERVHYLNQLLSKILPLHINDNNEIPHDFVNVFLELIPSPS